MVGLLSYTSHFGSHLHTLTFRSFRCGSLPYSWLSSSGLYCLLPSLFGLCCSLCSLYLFVPIVIHFTFCLSRHEFIYSPSLFLYSTFRLITFTVQMTNNHFYKKLRDLFINKSTTIFFMNYTAHENLESAGRCLIIFSLRLLWAQFN